MKRTTLMTAAALALSAWPLCAQDNPSQRQPGDRRDGGNAGGEFRRGLPGIFEMLDANHDGALDPAELDKAAEALRKLDRNGDGRVTPDEVRPRDDGQRRSDAGPREPRRDGDRPQAAPGQPPGVEGPRAEARRDGFGPRPPGERIEGRVPDRGFGSQRFAQRRPWLRDDRAAAGPYAMAPRFDAMRRERGPARGQREFAPQPPRPFGAPDDLRPPQPPRPPEMNPPGDRFQQRPPAMGGAPERGTFMRRGPGFAPRPPAFGSGGPANADRPPRAQGQDEGPRFDRDGPPGPPPPHPTQPPQPNPGRGLPPGVPPPGAL